MLSQIVQTSLQVWKLNAFPDLSISTQTYRFGVALIGVISADFNGDGKPDLAVVDVGQTNPGSLWILINNGDTTFKTPVQYNLPGFGGYLAAGDFNRDGNLDLALTVGKNVIIFLGNGDGTFRDAATYPAGWADHRFLWSARLRSSRLCREVRHPPRSGWLDELGRLKGGWRQFTRYRSVLQSAVLNCARPRA